MPKLPGERPYANPNYTLKARLEFCASTGFSSPEFVVKARVKTIGEWVETLDKHRVTALSRAKGVNDGNQSFR